MLKLAMRSIFLLLLMQFLPGSHVVVSAQLHLLLNTPEVLDILELDDDQRAVVKPLYEKYAKGEKMSYLNLSKGKPFTALSSVQQNELRPQFLEEKIKLDAQALKELTEVLSSEQMIRLSQLRIQALGASGLVTGQLNNAIGMTQEESDKLPAVVRAFQESFLATHKAELQAMTQQEIESFHKSKLIEAMVFTFTEEQQELYNKISGEPADLPPIKGLR